MSDNSLDPNQIWTDTKTVLRPQLTRATYDTILHDTSLAASTNGHYRVLVPTEPALEWLSNRLSPLITRALAGVIGHPVEIVFELAPAETLPPPGAALPPEKPAAAPASETEFTPGQVVAGADYIRAFIEGDKTAKIKPAGYSQIAHHTSFFHLPLLGPAFGLYKILESDDKRSLTSIAPNFWTPPARYSFQTLAEKLNKTHHRYVSGDTYECHYSRQARRQGLPLTGPADCCHSHTYDFLYLKPHPHGGYQCLHWVIGQLETLLQAGLARVEIMPGYKPAIQLWRMPPLITPYQYRGFTSQLQADFDRWLADYGYLFNIPHRDYWLSITEPYLAPLMPGYSLFSIGNNWFNNYKKRATFFAHACPNPAFTGAEDEN